MLNALNAMHAKPPAPALRLVDHPQIVRNAEPASCDSDPVSRDAPLRLRNSLDVPTLLAEVQSPDIATEKLVLLAMTTWKQVQRLLAAS